MTSPAGPYGANNSPPASNKEKLVLSNRDRIITIDCPVLYGYSPRDISSLQVLLLAKSVLSPFCHQTPLGDARNGLWLTSFL